MKHEQKLKGHAQAFAVAEQLLTTFDIEELLNVIVGNASNLLDAQGATLYLIDPIENTLVSQSIKSQKLEEIILPLSHSSIAAHTVLSGKSLNIKDPYGDLTYIHPDLRFNSSYDEVSGAKTRSIITQPLIINGSTIGVFQVVNKNEGLFDEDDQALLYEFSLMAAIAIANARLMEKIMETQESFSEIIENVSDMVITQNTCGIILFVNPSVVAFLKSRKRSVNVVGHTFGEVFPELESFRTEIDKVISGQLNKFVSHGVPSFVILTERGIDQKIEKVTLIIKSI